MSKPLRATISLLCTDSAKLYKLQNLFEFWVGATSSCDTCNGVSLVRLLAPVAIYYLDDVLE
mgnify:CR=1 FL=1